MPPDDTQFARLIARRLPSWRAETVFDVGANVGQSAQAFARAWPEAAIHCFEPLPATRARLTTRMAHLPGLTIHDCGLSDHAASARMTDLAASASNHLLDDPLAPGVEVRLSTGAEVMRNLRLKRLSYLKIDTEGHDLAVLHGFGAALQGVDFIQVEAGMNAYNLTHAPFAALNEYLTAQGFLLFHILEQVFEFKDGGRPVLRRANPVYIHSRLVDLQGIS